MGKIIFVSGTDTGVGKTLVSGLLAHSFLLAGQSIGVMKPLETAWSDPAISDAHFLWTAAGKKQEFDQVSLYRFREPLAPYVAAERSGVRIDQKQIVNKIRNESESCDFLIVEGAGGLMVPITEDYNYCDLAKDCQASVILVIGSRLGAINHSLLSFEVLANRKLPCLGYVINSFSQIEENTGELLAVQTNRDVLCRLAAKYQMLELANLPFFGAGLDSQQILHNASSAIISEFKQGVISRLNPRG